MRRAARRAFWTLVRQTPALAAMVSIGRVQTPSRWHSHAMTVRTAVSEGVKLEAIIALRISAESAPLRVAGNSRKRFASTRFGPANPHPYDLAEGWESDEDSRQLPFRSASLTAR